MSKRNLVIVLSVCLLAVGTAVYAKPKEGIKGVATVIAPPIATSTLNVVCIQKAVDTRDNAIIAALDAYHASVRSALETRRDALKNAWAIPNAKERRAALKKVWTNFAKAQKDAKKNLQKAKTAVWKQYRVDRKKCGKQIIIDDSAGEDMDSQL